MNGQNPDRATVIDSARAAGNTRAADILAGNFNCINYDTYMEAVRIAGLRPAEPEQPKK